MKNVKTTKKGEIQMKKVKTYRSIKSVEVTNEHIYSVDFYDKEKVLDPEEVLLTKDDVLEDAKRVIARGYGTYSGTSVWLLPQKITRQIKRCIGDRYSCELNE